MVDVPFAKTHDLARLGALAAPQYPLARALFEQTYFFTSWAFDFRYPWAGDELPPEPTDAELREAMTVIDRLVDCLRGHIPSDIDP